MATNGLRLLKQIVETTKATKCMESLVSGMKAVSCEGGRVQCEMRVEEGHTNRMGTLHGGMTATLVDVVSTWALITSPRQVAGVSVDLSVSYLRPVGIGGDILITANTIKLGKTLAFLTVDITNKSDGKLIAQGKHTKYIA